MVVCKRDGNIVAEDIAYALTVDRMFKGKLKDGDLDGFTEEQVESMKALCAQRTKEMRDLYDLACAMGK